MKYLLKMSSVVLLALFFSFFVACSEDSGGNDSNNDIDIWVGTWLSAGTDVAPLLVAVFSYDSVRVEINEDMTVSLSSHIPNIGWSTPITGVYVITESATGNVHSVSFNYSAFEQQGIMEITEGNPDIMRLEVVQTTPDIGATPRTPTTGFGSDVTLGTINIQTYKRVE